MKQRLRPSPNHKLIGGNKAARETAKGDDDDNDESEMADVCAYDCICGWFDLCAPKQSARERHDRKSQRGFLTGENRGWKDSRSEAGGFDRVCIACQREPGIFAGWRPKAWR